MDAAEQALKISTISTLPADELGAWYQTITGGFMGMSRPAVPGEVAAVLSRARELGVNLNKPQRKVV